MPTILLVEDALDLAQAIRRELEAESYTVLHAADGVQALELHASAHPDAIILDWMLPKMDGLAVLRRIRESSPTPVLMLTARGEEMDRVIGLEVGADDYVTKPFSMRELVARLHALLRRIEHIHKIVEADRHTGAVSLSYGPLQLDAEEFRATLDGKPIDLTRTEFDLLRLLLQNPERAFSRAYLLETLWDENFVVGDRAIDNTVMRLRKKLGPLGEAIETVWGIGYRLKALL